MRARTAAVGATALAALLALPASAAPAPPLAAAPLRGATQAAVEDKDLQVFLSSALVKLGEPVQISIRVQGDVRVRFAEPPAVEGLEFGRITSGASSRQISYDSRGRAEIEVTQTYVLGLRYAGPGRYEIPPLRVEIDGKIRTAPAAPMVLEVVEDIAASQLLVFECEPLPTRIYEGEPYTVDLRFGWDERRALDDAELQLPWWERQDGVVELESTASQRGSYEIAIRPGRRVASIEEVDPVERDGRRFRTYRLRRRYVATREGNVEFGRSVFKFTEVVGRSASVFSRGKRRAFYAALEPFSIEVLPVPEEGRPLEWTGAVGRFEVSRDAARRDVDLGDAIPFQVRWTGDGNLEFFDPPDLARLAAFDRFRVLGVTDEKNAGERLVTYDLVPLDANVEEIPPVPLSVFDTREGRYTFLESEPLRIRVSTLDGAAEDPFGEVEDAAATAPIVLRDIAARPVAGARSGGSGGGPGAPLALLALLAILVGWLVLRRWVRRRGDPASASARRRRGAAGRCAAELRRAAEPAAVALALERFLAARTGEVEQAWIGRARLADGPVAHTAPELETQYTTLRRDLDRAVFSVDAGDPATESARARESVMEFVRACVRAGV
ncbi:MAG: BatD family protein [Planctomycetota bacterium]